MNTPMTPEHLNELWRSPASWRYGLFYFCREDPRVIVPKRQKWRGWTVNFAKPSAIPVVVASIIFIALPLVYVAAKGLVLTWVWWSTLGMILLAVCAICWHFSSSERYKKK